MYFLSFLWWTGFSVAFKATENCNSLCWQISPQLYFSDVDKKYFRLSHIYSCVMLPTRWSGYNILCIWSGSTERLRAFSIRELLFSRRFAVSCKIGIKWWSRNSKLRKVYKIIFLTYTCPTSSFHLFPTRHTAAFLIVISSSQRHINRRKISHRFGRKDFSLPFRSNDQILLRCRFATHNRHFAAWRKILLFENMEIFLRFAPFKMTMQRTQNNGMKIILTSFSKAIPTKHAKCG